YSSASRMRNYPRLHRLRTLGVGPRLAPRPALTHKAAGGTGTLLPGTFLPVASVSNIQPNDCSAFTIARLIFRRIDISPAHASTPLQTALRTVKTKVGISHVAL